MTNFVWEVAHSGENPFPGGDGVASSVHSTKDPPDGNATATGPAKKPGNNSSDTNVGMKTLRTKMEGRRKCEHDKTTSRERIESKENKPADTFHDF